MIESLDYRTTVTMENSSFFDTESAVIEPSDPELSANEIARVLYSAWLQHKDPKDEVTTFFFTLNELHAMHRAWKKMASGRRISIDKTEIIDALARSVEMVIRPDPMPPGSYLMNMKYFRLYNAEKSLLMENLTREWEVITEGRELAGWNNGQIFENSQEIDGNEVEQDGLETVVAAPEDEAELRNSRDIRLRITELYDKVHGLVNDCVFHYLLCCLIIIWPISLGIIGIRYMDCHMGYHVPYYFIMLGLIGVVTILLRLLLMYLTMLGDPLMEWSPPWTGVKTMEIIFVVININQMCLFFGADHFSEAEQKQCKNFSRVALHANYVSLVFIAAYLGFCFYKCTKQFRNGK